LESVRLAMVSSASIDPPKQGVPAQFLRLTGLGVLVYIALAVFYSIPALSESRLNKELLVWPVTLLLLYLYWAGYRIVLKGGVSWRFVLGSGLCMAVVAVCIPPFHSTDIFGYINRGWQQAHYGMNPYVYTIDQVSGWEHDPMITNHWVNNPSPYGFLYLQIAKVLCLLGGGDKTLTLLLFKLSSLVVHFLTALLVWLGASRLRKAGSAFQVGFRPELSLFLYLWNPLVMIHGLANAHNDMWMGLFLTLSAYCAIAGAWVWIIPALMASTLIKYGAVVVLPLAGLFLIKQKAWKALTWGVMLGLAVFFVSGLPYLGDWSSFHLKEISRNAFVSHGSLHSLIYSAYNAIGKTRIPALYAQREGVRALLKNLLLAAYAGFYGWWALKRLRQSDYTVPDWVRDALLLMVLLVCLVSLKFYPWYLGMFFPLALYLREDDWLRRFTVTLSGAQLFSITFIGQAHLLNFTVMAGLPWTGIALRGLGLSWRRILIGSLSLVLGLLALLLLTGGLLSLFSSGIYRSETNVGRQESHSHVLPLPSARSGSKVPGSEDSQGADE
jgi:hypothetical protein